MAKLLIDGGLERPLPLEGDFAVHFHWLVARLPGEVKPLAVALERWNARFPRRKLLERVD